MRKALTAKTIEALKPGARRYDVHDVLCPGLSVRVGKQGHKTYTVKYRYGLKQRRLRLGVHPRISLAQAREKALDALRAVDEGTDPAACRRQLGTRVATVCEDFIRQHARPRNSSWREAERILQRELVAAYGQRDILRWRLRPFSGYDEGLCRHVTAGREVGDVLMDFAGEPRDTLVADANALGELSRCLPTQHRTVRNIYSKSHQVLSDQ